MSIEEHILSGFAEHDTKVAMSVKHSDGVIVFTAGENLKRALTNPLNTKGGSTVGADHRAWLHEHLDAWLDNEIERSI
jgi:hypothetical protein